MRLNRNAKRELREKVLQAKELKALDGEVFSDPAPLDVIPLTDNMLIPHDVWQLMQQNGQLATTRLNEMLQAHNFYRLKGSEQTRLIALAQDRAYGKSDAGIKRTIKTTVSVQMRDATAQTLAKLDVRASLPEYNRQRVVKGEADGGSE